MISPGRQPRVKGRDGKKEPRSGDIFLARGIGLRNEDDRQRKAPNGGDTCLARGVSPGNHGDIYK